MDESTRQWYRLKCELELRKKTGNAYQDFFSDVMELRHGSDFSRVRPWGNLGDRKCDGYLKSKKILFQLYAPNEMELKVAEKKIDEDYQGAEQYWRDHIGYWAFVHNSHNGLSADIEKKLADMRAANPKRNFCQYGPDWLLVEVMALDATKLAALLGPPNFPQMMQEVRASDIAGLIENVSLGSHYLLSELPIVPPDKMNFNDFGPEVRNFIEMGRAKEKAVEETLNNWPDPLYADRVADEFRFRYQELRDQDLRPDAIYFELQKFVGTHDAVDIGQQGAAYALLSYLFYHCDIFEREA